MKDKHFTISKSALIKGKKCAKALYFAKEEYNSPDNNGSVNRQKYERGKRIGNLAKQLFPKGVDIDDLSNNSKEEALLLTKNFIEKLSEHVIYNATFEHKGVFARIDILVFKNDAWYAFEVKSSPRVSSVYLFDAAIEYYVIEQSGMALKDFSVVHINDKYERNGELIVKEIFVFKSVKKRLEKMGNKVAHFFALAANVIDAEEPPEVPIGRHCLKPYQCDYKSKCWSNIEEQSVLNYVGLPISVKFEEYEKGNKRLDQLDLSKLRLGHKVHTKIRASIDNRIIIEKEKLKAFLNKRSEKLYFFDVEATQSAIPLYQKTRPYQMIPFLYSLHTFDKVANDSKVQHNYFISRPQEDDRKAMVEHFLKHTAEEGDIIVFNTYLERLALIGFAKICPEHKKAIEDRIKRLVDLETPFKEMWYYHPAMQCAHSLKAVLPCLVQDLNYENLVVKDGLEAMLSYQALIDHDERADESDRRLQDLVDYCKMDTYALFKIYESLQKLVQDV